MATSLQTILLTGATGFLGSHLARACLTAGHAVAALKRRGSRLDPLGDAAQRIRWFDIEEGVEAPFKSCGPIAAVVHTATCYGRQGETPPQVFEANTASRQPPLEAVCSSTPTRIHTAI